MTHPRCNVLTHTQYDTVSIQRHTRECATFVSVVRELSVHHNDIATNPPDARDVSTSHANTSQNALERTYARVVLEARNARMHIQSVLCMCLQRVLRLHANTCMYVREQADNLIHNVRKNTRELALTDLPRSLIVSRYVTLTHISLLHLTRLL
jgi:hypothetical protein